ncbi:DUF2207 domain-containing protein [Paenibacillus sambharensis]|uniref:DUF2207 domain-containing protein n=1 Tax=Paenibacillus sambharensis TaxID=1803190 RepID=A0A2W1LB23_9BACL|nr:DUF2207 domain-containing protein [Paenibacillus sambharensis]PZD95330.1 DUF2207 domain-containing protein [Paenibacillus sambharensis]
MNRRLTAAGLVTAVLGLMLLLGGCSSANEYSINQADIIAELLPDGDLYVEELFTYTVRGEYDRISRYMDNYGDSNIEFFEAYMPPDDRELGNFGYEGLERYPVSLDAKRGSYYADVHAKDETVQVYYRYRLDQEAVKYPDGGELDWTVLAHNEADHHNVTVIVRAREHVNEPLVGYAYDRSGGFLADAADRQVRYENKLLPEQDTVRLKVFFRAEAVPDTEVTAGTTRAERMLEETALKQQFAKRDDRLDAGREATLWLSCIAAAGAAFYALSLRRLTAWWRGRQVSHEQLEQMDPVRLVHLYRKGELRMPDVLAGVFFLRRRGMVDISMVESGTRFQEDRKAPKQLPQFAFRGSRSRLRGAERHLVSWLFGGTGVLDLEKISGPTAAERRQKGSMKPYIQRIRRFRRAFTRWRMLLEAQEGQTKKMVGIGEYKPGRFIFSALALVHLIVVIYLYMADVQPLGWIAVLALVLGGSAVWLTLRTRHKGFMTAYLAACFFAVAQIVHEPVVMEYFNFVLLSLILVWLLPGRVTDRDSEAFRSAIKRYRQRLARGGDGGSDPAGLERMMEDALLLGVGLRFLKHAGNNQAGPGFYSASPLFDPAAHEAINYAFIHSWKHIERKLSGSGGGGYGDGGSGFYGDGGFGGDSGSDGGSDSGGDGGGGGD